MAVPEQIPLVDYVADGTVKKFDVPFDYDQQEDLHLFVDGIPPTIDKYFFQDNAFNFYIAPTDGQKVRIERITPKKRDTDYDLHTNTIRPKALNNDFDRIWFAIQESYEDFGELSIQLQNEIIARIQADEEILAKLAQETADRILGDTTVSNDLKNYIDNMIALIIGDPSFDGINANKVNDGNQTQDQINLYGGKKYDMPVGGYPIGGVVLLDNGDFVKSTIPNNTNDPNVNMTGWSNPIQEVKSKQRKTPYDFGAKGGANDDTAAVKSCIESGYFLINDEHNVKPFIISDKYLDGHFTQTGQLKVFDSSGVDSIEFLNCHGVINNIFVDEDYASGVYATLLMRECDNLIFNKPSVKNGKLLPIAIVDSPNCFAIDGRGYADAGNQQGWWLSGSRNSQFVRCVVNGYSGGGFFIIGSGYKSGTRLMTTLPTSETLGMKAVNCFALNVGGVGFDINGAVGAEFLDCLAHQKDTVSQSACFQIKQSTNIPEETAFLTNQNKVTNCVAVNCARAFFSQRGENNIWTNITAINCRNDVFSTNATPRTILRGLNVFNFALKNVDQPSPTTTKSYVVSFFNASHGGSAKDIFLYQDTAPQNVDNSGVFNLASNECSIDNFKIQRRGSVLGTASLGSLLDISGNDCDIGDGVRYAASSIYKNSIVDDSTSSAKYPVNASKTVNLTTATNTLYLDTAIGSEVTIGNVVMNVFSTTKNVTGAKFAAGDALNVARYVNLENVPNGRGSFKPPASAVTAREIPFAVRVETTGSNTGSATILMKGVAI